MKKFKAILKEVPYMLVISYMSASTVAITAQIIHKIFGN